MTLTLRPCDSLATSSGFSRSIVNDLGQNILDTAFGVITLQNEEDQNVVSSLVVSHEVERILETSETTPGASLYSYDLMLSDGRIVNVDSFRQLATPYGSFVEPINSLGHELLIGPRTYLLDTRHISPSSAHFQRCCAIARIYAFIENDHPPFHFRTVQDAHAFANDLEFTGFQCDVRENLVYTPSLHLDTDMIACQKLVSKMVGDTLITPIESMYVYTEYVASCMTRYDVRIDISDTSKVTVSFPFRHSDFVKLLKDAFHLSVRTHAVAGNYTVCMHRDVFLNRFGTRYDTLKSLEIDCGHFRHFRHSDTHVPCRKLKVCRVHRHLKPSNETYVAFVDKHTGVRVGVLAHTGIVYR